MRINVFVLCLAGLTLPVFADEKLPLLKVGSQTYSNVTVTTVSATDIYFVSSQGMGNAKLKDLDPALQKQFHYDPARAQAMEQKQRIAANRLTVTINQQTIYAWRTADLESAKQEAMSAHKPIAWIAASPDFLNGPGEMTERGSGNATWYAFYVLRDKAILVFEDALAENHKVLPLVDKALHTPNPHYTPPSVVFLDPEAKKVLTVVTYEREFANRSRSFADALERIKGKY
jgi:hypothetical protein